MLKGLIRQGTEISPCSPQLPRKTIFHPQKDESCMSSLSGGSIVYSSVTTENWITREPFEVLPKIQLFAMNVFDKQS